MASPLLTLTRRLRYGRPIIVVSGLPRSGTSMAMRMLQAGGMDIVADGRRAADEDNPRGYFEDERVKDLERASDLSWLREARGKAIKVVSFLLRTLPGDNNYKVLFLHRELAEILASQDKMLARRGEPAPAADDRTLALLHKELADARFFLRRRHFEVLELRYRETLSEPLAQARRIARFVALPLDTAAMARAVDPALYRNRSS